MDRATRRDKTERAECRRWSKWAWHQNERYFRDDQRVRPHLSRWSGEPTYTFLLCDTRLLMLYWLKRLVGAARQRRWVIESHNCSCPMCRSHTRRHNGNSVKGQTIQERRQRAL